MPGPFDEYLSQPAYNPPRMQPSGAGGALETIGTFATEFLRGASQARARKFMESEQQRDRNLQALMQMAQFAQQADIAPSAKQQLSQGIMQRLVAEVASADNGVKGKEQGGNPFFGFVKNIASNLMGGQVPKVKPLDEAALGGFFQQIATAPKASEIQTTASQSIMDAFTDIATRNNGVVPRQELLAHPKFREGFSALEENGMVDKIPPSVQLALQGVSTPEDVRYARSTENIIKAFSPTAQPGQPQVAQPATEPPVSGPPVAAAGNIPAAAVPAVPPAQQFAQVSGQQQMPSILTGRTLNIPLADMKRVGITPREFVLYRGPGDFIEAEQATLPDGRTITWRKGTNEEVDVATAARQRYTTLDKLPASAIGQTPEMMEASRKDIEGLIANTSVFTPEDRAVAMSAAEIHLKHGQPEKALASVERLISDRRDKLDRERRDAEMRAERERSRAESRALREAVLGSQRALQADRAISGWRGEITKSKAVQAYEKMLPEFENARIAYDMAQQAGDDTALGIADTNLVRALAKATDIDSTVREGEQQVYRDAQGWKRKYSAIINGGMVTGAFLDPSTRRTMMDAVKRITEAQEKAAISAAAPVYRSAMRSRYKPNEDEILPDVLAGKIKMDLNVDPPKGDTARANPGWNPGSGGAGVIVQQNRSTGEFRHSVDGGKTWRPGKP